jgi:hypothetical protein
MKSSVIISILLVLIISACFTGCKKKVEPVNYTMGTFPDSVYNLTGLNSRFDDYNSDIMQIGNVMPVIFSSNRNSSGGQFDLVQGSLWYQFDVKTGAFSVGSALSNDSFLDALIRKANTSANDFGPYSIYSANDGYNYLFLASQSGTTQLDIYYLKYLPQFGSSIPVFTGPLTAKLLNSGYDDAYISFDLNEDTVYFTSNRGGNFDIYFQKKYSQMTLDTWMSNNYSASTLVDSVNSDYDDKCPFVFQDYMVFTSNRPGGLGGYDLYYSVFRNGKWNYPVNMGPKINSSSDEYRPLLGYHPVYSNLFMVYSSDKPGGAGGFDLYFTSFNKPK